MNEAKQSLWKYKLCLQPFHLSCFHAFPVNHKISFPLAMLINCCLCNLNTAAFSAGHSASVNSLCASVVPVESDNVGIHHFQLFQLQDHLQTQNGGRAAIRLYQRCQYMLNEMLWNLWRRAWRTDKNDTKNTGLQGSTVQTHSTFTPEPATYSFRHAAPSKGKPGYRFITGHMDESSRHWDAWATAEDEGYGGFKEMETRWVSVKRGAKNNWL